MCTARVLYVDTDPMGMAHHGAALRWFEQGRCEWLRQRGRTYRDLEAAGTLLPIYELRVRYRRPARYDELLAIHTELGPVRPVRVVFRYRVVRQADGVLLVEGETHHACVDRQGRPWPLPDDLHALLQAHAAPSNDAGHA
ncbi:MAG: thioesterase family protein [Myxococcales bacterium]|nr:acyl-CoA thioesterase [Myxococcota bacterium]MDW8281903.1 thioesterase family protein [Myxococcales bacterium]